MFGPQIETLVGERSRKVRICRDGRPVSYAEALNLWQTDERFRSLFISILSEVEFPSYRWETPPVCKRNEERPFEFVILASPELDTRPDPTAFASYFDTPDVEDGIVTFPNLGNDAFLVVPTPREPISAYGHLAAFTRKAPQAQNHALWRIVGRTMQHRLGNRPIWLSTAGGGVAWLHVRLDSRPKYYAFGPYRGETA